MQINSFIFQQWKVIMIKAMVRFFLFIHVEKEIEKKNASYKCYTIVKSNCSRNESSSSVEIMVVEKRAID